MSTLEDLGFDRFLKNNADSPTTEDAVSMSSNAGASAIASPPSVPANSAAIDVNQGTVIIRADHIDTASINLAQGFTSGQLSSIPLPTDGLRVDYNGIYGRKAGVTTFSLDTTGTLVANSAVIRGRLTADNLFFTKQFVMSYFESLDAWDKSVTGTINNFLGYTYLQTGNISATECYIDGAGQAIEFASKNPALAVSAKINSITNQIVYLYTGQAWLGDGTDQGFGFKIVDGTLYASSKYTTGATSTETATVIPGIVLTDYHIYRAEMTSGSKVDYYVDNVLKATITTNLPDLTVGAMFDFYIKNSANENKVLYLTSCSFWQDL